MPPLSEAWATAYVQILIMLIIFALGIPALAIQFVVQEDIRTVFQRRWKSTVWVISVVSIVFAFITFLWILHPPFKKAEGGRPATNPEIIIPLKATAPTPADNGPAPVDMVVAVGRPRVGGAGPGDEESSMTTPIASFLMTAILLGLLGSGFMYTVYLKRQHIIKELEKDLIQDFCGDASPGEGVGARLVRRFNSLIGKKPTRKLRSKKKKRSGPPAHQKLQHLDEEMLSDLIYLGRNGKAGRDKTLVLSSLDRIADAIQNSERYQGDELEDLIRGLKDIILDPEQHANDDNFGHAVEVLKGIRYRLADNAAHVPKYIDAGQVNIVLEDLGVEAVRNRSRNIAEICLEEASASSRIIFRIGTAALYDKQFHVAVVALNKLEALADDKNLSACPETFDLLGLLAHFTVNGTASSMRAASFLSENIASFSRPIGDCLSMAYKHHYENSDFETADAVVKLKRVVRNRSWKSFLSLPA